MGNPVAKSTEAELSPASTAVQATDSPQHQETEKAFPDSEVTEQPVYQAPSEGGTQGWLTVLGAHAALIVSFGWVNSMGVFQAHYETHQLKNFSSSEVAWITSVEFFFLFSFSPISGKLFDSYGPRLPLIIGSFMHIFGLMMTSISTKYYQILLSQSVCSGIGCSFIFSPSITAPQTWFNKHRGIVGGLTVAGSSIGGIVFPLMLNRLIVKIGYGWAMRVSVFMIIILLLLAIFTIKSNRKHTPDRFNPMNYIRPFKELNFSVMCLAQFFFFLGLYAPFNFVVVQAIHLGMDRNLAFSLVPIINAASLFGRTIPSIIADRAGRWNVIVITVVSSTIFAFGLWLPATFAALLITFSICIGISTGAVFGLAPSLMASISPIEELGVRIGGMSASGGIGALISPPIGGGLIALNDGNYTYVAIYSGISFLISTIACIFLRVRLGGWKIKQKI
ncbi:hypothetical protein FQN57_001379 [Myotisia sp. PD_48]|nr:hypothetical protein FQN57_001379 [Myotisia sp. PD_48]